MEHRQFGKTYVRFGFEFEKNYIPPVNILTAPFLIPSYIRKVVAIVCMMDLPPEIYNWLLLAIVLVHIEDEVISVLLEELRGLILKRNSLY